MQYRPEIDGLRALAVVPVILFHAGISTFSGGFIGVDVFFVISGYLITTIIATELDEGRFTILNFYERRTRRILPALYAMLLALCAYCLLIQSPHLARDLSQSITATTLFSENILLWLESSNYFALETELKPLLHAWSLGVEEQYYLFVPFALILLWRYARSRVVLIFCVGLVVSLALGVWASQTNPAAAFYLLPMRAWELLIGALAAMYLRYGMAGGVARANQPLSLLGAAMIVVPIFLLDAATPWPGFYALVPTLGAVLIILFAGEGTWVRRALGITPLVAIGLASYSAYLWHQPILAVMRATGGELDGMAPVFVFLALTVLASALSYYLVETPFRKKQIPVRWQQAIFALLSIGFIAFGVVGNQTRGFENWKLARITPERQQMFVNRDELVKARNARRDQILAAGPASIRNAQNVVIGDSMADDLLVSLDAAGEQAFRVKIDGSCLAELLKKRQACETDLDALLSHLGAGQTVWIAWDFVRDGTQALIPQVYDLVRATGADTKVLGGFVMQDVSNGSFDYMRQNAPMMDINADYFGRRDPRNSRNAAVRALVGEADFIDKETFFCDETAQRCRIYAAPDKPQFYDQLHMTLDGLRYFGQQLRAQGRITEDLHSNKPVSAVIEP